MNKQHDVIILGAGMAGLTAAARLQAQGLSTLILEVHDKVGGCSGYYERNGFHFDVGATTLVNFEKGSIGEELLQCIGIELEGDILPGYKAWLPDRTVFVSRDKETWEIERKKLSHIKNHDDFWKLFDRLSDTYWSAVDQGVKLPIQSIADIYTNIQAVGWQNILDVRYLFSSLGSQIDRYNLRQEQALIGLLSMMIEDTLHSRTVDDAPFINASLGCSIRGHIIRPRGGMYGFFKRFYDGYRNIGGEVLLKHKITEISGEFNDFTVNTKRGEFKSRSVISTLPMPTAYRLCADNVQKKLKQYYLRDQESYGAGILLTLGVPEEEVNYEEITHHQLLQDYDLPLGNGNNMFISVSSVGDTLSAPKGYRSVMVSTHAEIGDWQNISDNEFKQKKLAIGKQLLQYARRVYPNLGNNAEVFEIATPITYQRFARRPFGAVGGVRQTMSNSNQFAIPQNIGVKGFYLAGEYTWPGVGTTACVIGGKIAANALMKDLKH